MKALGMILGVFLFFGLTINEGLSAEDVSSKLPPFISINTFEVGSSGFMTLSYATEGITQKTNQKFRILPATTDVGRLSALRSGSIHFSAAGVGGIFASSGREEFANRSWGPQDVYTVWCAAFPGWGMTVRGDSGIKTPADLRGKRVAYAEGWPGTNVQVEATLAFGGLKWEDVKIVKVSSHAAAAEGLLSGTIDSFNSLPTAAFAYRLQTSSHGVAFIKHAHNDEEGWKRARAIFPFLAKYKAVTGAGLSKENPLETFTNGNPMVIALGSQNADLVYWLMKAFAESYPEYSQKAEIMKTNWTMEWNIELLKFTKIPVHPGAIRYLKEAGKWTPELDKLNEERLRDRKLLLELWKKAVDSSKKENISDQDFPGYWAKMRAQAGPQYAW